MWLSLVIAAACLIALADCPYGYYQLLRVAVTGYAIWIVFLFAGKNYPAIVFVFGLIALLYNPVFKISMNREVHVVENICTAFAILAEVLWTKRWLATRKPN